MVESAHPAPRYSRTPPKAEASTMGVPLREMLDRLPGQRRAALEARAAELIAGEHARRNPQDGKAGQEGIP